VDGTLFGGYRLVELLGRGVISEVWRAFDTVTSQTVALKVLSGPGTDDRIFQQRFRREARVMARLTADLNDPHVVSVYNIDEIEGRLCVAMQFIDGRDLESMIEDGPLEPARSVAIIEQVAAALDAVHRLGMLHRRVKPSNILIADDDFAYTSDLYTAETALSDEALMRSGAMSSSKWARAAPEEFTAFGAFDRRSDVYGLACALYQCLTGQTPFPARDLEQLIVAKVSTPPPRPSACPGVPTAFDDVIAKGMAKDPDARYAGTLDLARAARDAITTPA
jgi:serine/threonine protein kinase